MFILKDSMKPSSSRQVRHRRQQDFRQGKYVRNNGQRKKKKKRKLEDSWNTSFPIRDLEKVDNLDMGQTKEAATLHQILVTGH